MERCLTGTLSIPDQVALLTLWHQNKHVIYGNLTVQQFLSVLYMAINRGLCYVGRTHGRPVALVIYEDQGETCYAETFMGPARFARAWQKEMKGKFKYLTNWRNGSLHKREI